MSPVTISTLLIENDGSAEPYSLGDKVDNASPFIAFSDHGWEHRINKSFSWMNTVSSTSTVGAWVHITFSADRVYGVPMQEQTLLRMDLYSLLDDITIESTVRSIMRAKNTEIMTHQVLLFNHSLSGWASMHSYNISVERGALHLDFIRINGTILQSRDLRPGYSDTGSVWARPVSPEASAEAIVFALCTILLILFCVSYLLFVFCRRRIWNATHRRTKGSESTREESIFVGQQVRRRCSPLVISTPRQGELNPTNAMSKYPILFTPYSPSGGLVRADSCSHISSSHVTLAPPQEDMAHTSSTSHAYDQCHDQNLEILQLSHNDLARVFDRAQTLQLLARDIGQNIPPEDGNEDYFENLARRLAMGAYSMSNNSSSHAS
ncbi:hypothetical protein PIIN_00823 [Serendipita indica DSM 11827]|uniref:Uncharacterized protein n=1 Tax=Serendipita indica (strain DSM 11827) TaxID=1109443 RepID=G4T6S1_SERID|nr:hypothetical protein PIIN_00823 [Serendipita indica DSM 11827]